MTSHFLTTVAAFETAVITRDGEAAARSPELT